MKPVIIIVIAVVFGIGIGVSINVSAEEGLIPSWIKSTASFWVDGQIGNSEFLSALQFLVKEGILIIPAEENDESFYVPKVTRDESILEGNDVLTKFTEYTAFRDSLTEEQLWELILKSVEDSEFAYIVSFDGKFSTRTYVNFEKLEGEQAIFVPFDCTQAHNYGYAISASKDKEGKMIIMVFKNKIMVDYKTTEIPVATLFAGINCLEPNLVIGLEEDGSVKFDYSPDPKF